MTNTEIDSKTEMLGKICELMTHLVETGQINDWCNDKDGVVVTLESGKTIFVDVSIRPEE